MPVDQHRVPQVGRSHVITSLIPAGSGLADQVNGDSFWVFSIPPCRQTTAPRTLLHALCQRFVTHAVAFWLACCRLNRPCNYGWWVGSSGSGAPCAGAFRANLPHEDQLSRRRLSSSTVGRSCPAASGSDGEVDLCFYRDLGHRRHQVYKRQFETKTLHFTTEVDPRSRSAGMREKRVFIACILAGYSSLTTHD